MSTPLMGYRPKEDRSNKQCIHKHRLGPGKSLELEYRVFEDGHHADGFVTLAEAIEQATPRKPGRPKKQASE